MREARDVCKTDLPTIYMQPIGDPGEQADHASPHQYTGMGWAIQASRATTPTMMAAASAIPSSVR